jgi:hypothetical protein
VRRNQQDFSEIFLLCFWSIVLSCTETDCSFLKEVTYRDAGRSCAQQVPVLYSSDLCKNDGRYFDNRPQNRNRHLFICADIIMTTNIEFLTYHQSTQCTLCKTVVNFFFDTRPQNGDGVPTFKLTEGQTYGGSRCNIR